MISLSKDYDVIALSETKLTKNRKDIGMGLMILIILELTGKMTEEKMVLLHILGKIFSTFLLV